RQRLRGHRPRARRARRRHRLQRVAARPSARDGRGALPAHRAHRDEHARREGRASWGDRDRPARGAPPAVLDRAARGIAMSAIELIDVTKRYRDGTVAVRDLNLKIEDGEFMILVGPSGCGKTTTLRMIAGLETITSGELRIGG